MELISTQNLPFAFLIFCLTILQPCFGALSGDIRLAAGETPNEGRLEVYYQGKWGMVKGQDWGISESRVVCRQLGFGDVAEFFDTAGHFPPGIGTVSWQSVNCRGDEGRLSDCTYAVCSSSCKDHSQDLGIICEADFPGGKQNGDVRIVDGPYLYEGRLEVFYGGAWGTVCDNNWDTRDADVVCRMLGYDRGADAPPDTIPGQGLIVLDSVYCEGYENSLVECSHSNWLKTSCEHHEDVGIKCLNALDEYEGAVRLLNGSSPSESDGRIEIFHNQTWGAICADKWNLADSTVVCRQLGFTGAVKAVIDGSYGESGAGAVGITVNGVLCRGTEGQLLECIHLPWYHSNCTSSIEAAVICDTTPVGTYTSGDVRVLEDNNVVEVYYAGAWGTICPQDWDINDGDVVCQKLRQTYAWDVSQWSDPSNATLEVIVTDVMCNGEEGSILECNTGEWYINDCIFNTYATVSCMKTGISRIRLAGGPTPHEGRLEIYYNEWGTVCDDAFHLYDAQVVCRELGYRGAFAIRKGAYYGEGVGPVLLDELNCDGSERTLYSCRKSDWVSAACDHTRDVGVMCVPDFDEKASEATVRLRDGQSGEFEGRVEIYHDGAWGTVCDDGWAISENLDTVCEQLGYRRYITGFYSAYFGQGSGDILLDDVKCSYAGMYLYNCDHSGWNQHDCTHDEDASVRCNPADFYDSRLRNGPGPFSGRVEIFEGGTWHKVDLANFTQTEADVVCRQRGLHEAVYIRAEEPPLYDEYVPYFNGMFSCTGNELDLRRCVMSPRDAMDMNAGLEAAYVECFTPTDGLTGGEIAAIVIVAVFGVILIAGVVVFILKK